MSTTIPDRLDEPQEPPIAPAWRGASPEGERSDALALRAVSDPSPGARRRRSRRCCPTS